MTYARWLIPCLLIIGPLCVNATTQDVKVKSVDQNAVDHPDRHWTTSMRQLLQRSEVKSFTAASTKHRLHLRLDRNELRQGTTFNVLCCVENYGGFNQPLLNPFFSKTFPCNLVIAVYDADGKLLHAIPSQHTAGLEADDNNGVELPHYELRGKWVKVYVGRDDPHEHDDSVPLKPGDYQLQLIACERFFMGDFAQHGTLTLDDREVKLRADSEAARSDVVSLRVVSTSEPAVPEQQSIEDKPKLLATLEVKDCPTDHPDAHFGKKYFALTLTNLSQTDFIGLIDPFGFRSIPHPKTKPLDHPIHWTYLRPDGTKTDSNDPSPRWYLRKRTDFVIIPPKGVAARIIAWLPSDRGEHTLSVELERGIIVDKAKLDILRSGEIDEGWTVGGIDQHVLHSDSVLSVKAVVE